MTTDNSSPSTVCIVLFLLWALSALISAITALLYAVYGCRDDAIPWLLFTVIALLVSERYRK